MKKILIVVMMCLMSAVTFGRTNAERKDQLKDEVSITSINKGSFFCTVTVTVRTYYAGNYIGQASRTASVDGPFGCTLAYMMARDAALEAAPEMAVEFESEANAELSEINEAEIPVVTEP